MPHSVFTLVTSVSPGQQVPLEAVLATIQAGMRGDAAGVAFPFRQLHRLHFASFVIFDDTPAALLVFENNIDDSIDEYLDDLLAVGERFLDAIYQHCAGYPV